MAKKRVKYAFGTREQYDAILKKDQNTVYFIYDTVIDDNSKEIPGEYGTIFKGGTRLGSSIASEIVFGKQLTVEVIHGETEDESVYYSIEEGTTFAQFAEDIFKAFTDRTQESGGILYAVINNETNKDGGIIHDYVSSAVTTEVSKHVGRLEELAELLDDETLDRLIKASEDIANVLADYYTKDETDDLIASASEICTFDTYDDFPSEGDSSKLYVDSENNALYRWGKDDATSTEYTYVEISGGGDTSVDVETHLYVKGGHTSISIAKGSDYTIDYAFSCANTYTKYIPSKNEFKKVEAQLGSIGYVKYYLDGIEFASGTCKANNYDTEDDSNNVYNTYRIPNSKFTSTAHTLKIVATDITRDHSAEISVSINIVDVTLTSSYSPVPTKLTNNINVKVTVSSKNPVDVFYKVDDDDVKTGLHFNGGSNFTGELEISNKTSDGEFRTHGIHNLSIWAETKIDDNTLSTNTLTYSIIWYDPERAYVPIISFECTDDKDNDGNYSINQYDYSTFKYQINPNNTNIDLVLQKNNEDPKIINSLTVDTTVRKWSYIFEESGTYDVYIIAHYTENGEAKTVESNRIPIIVKASENSLNAVDGAVLYMTAKNHDNNGSHEWKAEIGDVTAELTNFAWNDLSGWHIDGATTSLRVAGGAKCIIPFELFGKNYAESGMTIEFDFSTSNLSNSETTVIKSYSDDDRRGIIINATNAYWETGTLSQTDNKDDRIKVSFKEQERMRMSFVMTPIASDENGNAHHDIKVWNSGKYETIDSVEAGYWKFLKVYINGICVKTVLYTNDGAVSQQINPSYIEIGSSEATVDIYGIRFYNKTLYDSDIVKNYIADTQDPVEKLNIFNRNNVLNDTGTAIDAGKLSRKIPCLYVTCESTSTYSGFTNPTHILPMNKENKQGYCVVFNCNNLDDEAKEKFPWATSFIAFNARMNVQGTSSQYYPRKNYKLVFKCDKSFDGTESSYNKLIATKKPTFLFVGTTGRDYENTMTPEEYIKSMCTDPDMLKYYAREYKLRVYPENIAGADVEKITSLGATDFCLKADFMDSSSTHNTGLAKYVDFLYKSLGRDYLTPPQQAEYDLSTKTGDKKMIDVSLRTSVDGYPIAIFWRSSFNDNYTFLGKYNFNIDKGAENVFGFTDVDDYSNPYTNQKFITFNEDYYDNASVEDRKSYESPVECWEFTNNSTALSKFKDVTDNTFTVESTENGKTGTAGWMESFENRHPDNDQLLKDMTNMLVVPQHWKEFCKWVSSTDRNGEHNGKKVPYAWNNSYNELIASAAETKYFISLDAYFDKSHLNKEGETLPSLQDDPLHYAVKNPETDEYFTDYILEPQVNVDIETGEWGGDSAYNFFGYIVTFDPENKVFKMGEKYTAEANVVDTKKCYYINNDSDSEHYKKCYQFNTSTLTWEEYATLDDFKLDSSVQYGSITYEYDTAECRLGKFTYELSKHMKVDFTIVYYIITEFFACVDQRAKNMMFASWGYEPTNSNVKPASAFVSEEEAKAAGFKPVYKYNV